MTRALILAVLAAAGAAVPAAAQVHPADPFERHRWQAEQHRTEMDRLRLRADQREAEARRHALDARLTRLEIEARRAPEPYIPATPPALRTPEAERAAREAATARRRATAEGVGQIDAWLDRRPN